MQIPTIFLATFIATASAAGLDIKLLHNRWCLLKIGKACNDIQQGQCCSDNKPYKSAMLGENGGAKPSDQIRLFDDAKCGGAVITQKNGKGCVTSRTKDALGAAVFAGVGARDGQSVVPMEIVAPDEIFLEDGLFKYSVKSNSTEGKAYDLLESIDDQIEHLRTFGTRLGIAEEVE